MSQGKQSHENQTKSNWSGSDGSVEVPDNDTNKQQQLSGTSAMSRRSQTLSTNTQRTALGSCVCLVLLVIVSALVWYFVVIMDADPHNLPESWTTIFDEDPFDAVGPEDAMRWSNSGNGLKIEVVNLLDERWRPYFEQSIMEWDSGYPDALDLTTNSRTPESNCDHESNRIMVCNGNYGETGWKGRAEILSDGVTSTILAAVAQMNEYYLSSRNTDEMQYAMCHELGHTFGLHHTDENFGNRDLGNCMDYTNRHRNNLTPDASNYEFLHALYGLVPNASPFAAPTPAPVPTTAPVGMGSNTDITPSTEGRGFGRSSNRSPNIRSNPAVRPSLQENEKESKKEQEKKEEEDDRALEQVAKRQGELPDWLMDAIQAARKQEFEGESHRIELPGGFFLQIHQFKA